MAGGLVDMGVTELLRLGLLGAGENGAFYPCQAGFVGGIVSGKHFFGVLVWWA